MALANPSPLYLASYVCWQVIDKQQSLDQEIQAAKTQLPSQHHPWLQELCYGVCRYYGYYDKLLSQLLSKPIKSSQRIVHFVLVCGLHQLHFMKTPDYAVLDECVKLSIKLKKQWAKGLINAVLRQYLRQQKQFEPIFEQRDELSFEGYVGQEIKRQWPQRATGIYTYFNQYPPLTLRINQLKTTREAYLALLKQHGIQATINEDVDTAVTLTQAVNVEQILGFNQGMVSVQDTSAQLAAGLLQLKPGMMVLDGCAAPGGKTGELLEAMPEIQLTAVDYPQRTDLIEQNLQRLQLSATIVCQPLQEYIKANPDIKYDRILLDVPCSGSGVIARHPDIRYRRKQGDLEQFQAQQLCLLEAAWQVLKVDGLLLYVTCSILQQENDDVIERFIKMPQAQPLHVAHTKNLKTLGHPTRYGVQRLPTKDTGDGFYYCLLQKRA